MTLAERPDLVEESFTLGPDDEIGYFSPAGWLYSCAADTRWAAFTLVFLRANEVVARASTIPFRFGDSDRDTLPLDGFDGVVRWAAEDVLTGRVPNCLAALEISVSVKVRGEGVSSQVLTAVRELARSHGFAEVVCPVRPTEKTKHPRVAMADYAAMARDDGLPSDPWLRVHVRAGGEVLHVAPFSMVMTGSIAEWQERTGLALEVDGETELPGALVPILVNHRQDLCVYVEPNVWVRHRSDSAHA